MRYTYVEEKVETKTERRIRIFLAFQFFLQTVLTTVSFMADYETGEGVSPLQMLIQTNGYQNTAQIMLAVYGGILVVFPMTAFFFFVLDKKSKVKYLVSTISCFTCVALICFEFRQYLGIGAVLTLIVCIISMFMTSQGFQATRMRERQS